jgi:hypothetical protein
MGTPTPGAAVARERASRLALRVTTIRSLLDRYDRVVLYHLCVSGPALSSVTLAADLWGEGQRLGWLTTELSLERLNVLGLVIYRLGHHDIYVEVRATRIGYAVADVEWRLPHEVGRSRLRDFPVGGDMTEYRRHGLTAVGMSEVERMPIEQHCEVYYEHAEVHMRQLEEWWNRSDGRVRR